MTDSHFQLAKQIAFLLSALPGISAISIGGSVAGSSHDTASDIDLHVFCESDPPIDMRREIISPRTSRMEIGNTFFGAGDEWIEQDTGQRIDIMYFQKNWIKEQLDRVLKYYQPSLGYTTCFLYTIQQAISLIDPSGWLAGLQSYANQPYPEQLRKAIISFNHPVLRNNISSYYHQIELAIHRQDWISINHRVSALLASYFDILFAINRVAHPGEKRLVSYIDSLCPDKPQYASKNLTQVYESLSSPTERDLLHSLNLLLDNLDEWLQRKE
jgi:hypothetical protein